MQIALNLCRSAGAWWPQSATFAADFCNDRYMLAGAAVPAAAAFSFSRGSIKYAQILAGDFVAFAPDELARTNLGASIEPAGTNILTEPVTLGAWSSLVANATPLSGPPMLGIFAAPHLVTDSGGNVLARLRHPAVQTCSAGMNYALSVWMMEGSSGQVSIATTGNSGNSRITLALANGQIVSSSTSRGPMTLQALRRHGGVYKAEVSWVPNFSGPFDVGIGPGSGVLGQTIVALGAFAEAGTLFGSPAVGVGVSANRATDTLVLNLPTGNHQVTFTFDDGSEQVRGAAGGAYTVPTNLSRPSIARVVAIPA